MKTSSITPESLTVIHTPDLKLNDKKITVNVLLLVSLEITLKGLTLQNITRS